MPGHRQPAAAALKLHPDWYEGKPIGRPGADPRLFGDSNRQIVWISDILRRRCYSAMIMLGSDNQGLEALWVRAA